MTWSSLIPWIPVIAAGFSALLGGWLGGRMSRRNQLRQHEHERAMALSTQGREKAGEALTALQHLQSRNIEVSEWSGIPPRGEPDPLREQHRIFGEGIRYITDETARRQAELVYNVIGQADSTVYFSGGSPDDRPGVVWQACKEGNVVISRYLRGEPALPPSPEMTELERKYTSAQEEIEKMLAERDAEWEKERKEK